MAEFHKVTEGFWISPQLTEADFQRAAQDGFAMVINNRPEGEAPDQLSDDDARRAASRAGLGYEFIPANMAALSPAQPAAMASALERASGPVLAYCASGLRSAALWALAQAGTGRPPEEVLGQLRAAGLNLDQLAPALQAAAQQQQ